MASGGWCFIGNLLNFYEFRYFCLLVRLPGLPDLRVEAGWGGGGCRVITGWFSYKVTIIGWECLFLVSAEERAATPTDL